MLSRSAQGLYWMGRYLERAEHLCHLLRLQVETLVDRPIREIHFGWNRIYDSLGRRPPGGDLDVGASDDYTLADSYTLAGDLTFERTNSDSIRNCFAAGRENARQMRHCISAEMWTCLNLAWLRIRELDIEDIWKVSPESFYARTTQEIDTFIGVAEATMYRDEGWRFMRIGRFTERSQLLVALLLGSARRGSSAGRSHRRGLDEPAARLPRIRRLQAQLQCRGPPGAGPGPARHRPPAAQLAVPLARHAGVRGRGHRSEPGLARRRRGRTARRPVVHRGPLRVAGPGGSGGPPRPSESALPEAPRSGERRLRRLRRRGLHRPLKP